MNKRTVYYSLPVWMRYALRSVYCWPRDILAGITKKRHKYEPPKGRIFIGSGDFIAQGRLQLELLKKHAGLLPDHSVLDIGSGMGRTAVALTTYLLEKGKYQGFDIVKPAVKWCKERISRDHPNFTFRFAQLGNDLYKSKPNNAENFKFPYDSDRFDVIFLFSVFTHMLPVETSNYLAEIHRTLKPGGKCLATFFLYDENSENHIAKSNNGFNFPVQKEHYRLMSEKVRSANVALNRSFLIKLVHASGLRPDTYIDGYWQGIKTRDNDFQDIVILSKPIT